MEVSTVNEIKIYNLSHGKSLPDWISEKKRRRLQKNVGIRKRIELLQDFEMPDISTGIKMSSDGQYILSVGTYKPRVRCHEVNNLSMKFDRCFNSEAVQFKLLSSDYSKILFLQNDRYVELHNRSGAYYRWRIPKFGRDMDYNLFNCNVYFVGASSQVFRMDMEQGRFLPPLQTKAGSINKVKVNIPYDSMFFGTNEGKVEAWDPRSRPDKQLTELDIALGCVSADPEFNGVPSVTYLNFWNNGLNMAVGTATGQVLLYDLRSNKPFLVKDHMYDLPVKSIDFVKSEDLVVSMDMKHVRMWNQNSGKHYTAIHPNSVLNDMCLVRDTGLIFLANDDVKMGIFFVPSIGPAPKWCHFLDSITEELEESYQDIVYDDYKFVTKEEIQELGLQDRIGTNIFRAYMHGYFMNTHLYNKVKAFVKPVTFEDLKKKKISEIIDAERESRIKMKKLPAVNRDLALKLMEQRERSSSNQKGTKAATAILDDPRFKALFEDPEFEIDPNAELSGLTRPSVKKSKKFDVQESSDVFDKFEVMEDEKNRRLHSSSSEDEFDFQQDNDNEDVSEQSTIGKTKKNLAFGKDVKSKQLNSGKLKPKLYEIKEHEKFTMRKKDKEPENNVALSLEDRLKNMKETFKQQESSSGNKVFTFTSRTEKSESQKKAEEKLEKHIRERAKLRRPAPHHRKIF